MPKEAIKIQNEIKNNVLLAPLSPRPADIQYVAGVDVSLNRFGKDLFAGILVFEREPVFGNLTLVDSSFIKSPVTFPYVPGLLSFREIPGLIEAWNKLKIKPELVLIDGHGIAHPRRLGIAAHFGLVTGVPTIGVAKSPLYGMYIEPEKKAGSVAPITDPKTDEQLGFAFRSKENVRPIFISPGHLCSIEDSFVIVSGLVKKHRLPEPTRLAHNAVNEFRLSTM